MDILNISQTSVLVGVSEKTLRVWDKKGKLRASKTDGGHRRYETQKVLEFLKTYKKDTLDEYIESDIFIEEKRDINTDELAFWTKHGHIKPTSDESIMPMGGCDFVPCSEDRPLATILTNQMEYLNWASSEHTAVEPEFWLKTLVKIWEKDITHKFVSWQPIRQPVGEIFYSRLKKRDGIEFDFTIESESIVAKTSLLFKFSFPGDSEDMIVLDPKTFEQLDNKLRPNNYKTLSLDDFSDYMATKVARCIANEVISDLCNQSADLECNILDIPNILRDRFLFAPTSLITGELGLSLLDSAFGIADKKKIENHLDSCFVGKVGETPLYYSPDVQSEILISSAKGLQAAYFYAPYHMLTIGPKTSNGRSLFSRYGKKLLRLHNDYLGKVTF